MSAQPHDRASLAAEPALVPHDLFSTTRTASQELPRSQQPHDHILAPSPTVDAASAPRPLRRNIILLAGACVWAIIIATGGIGHNADTRVNEPLTMLVVDDQGNETFINTGVMLSGEYDGIGAESIEYSEALDAPVVYRGPQPAPRMAPQTAVIKTDSANLRKGPGKNYAKIKQVYKGDVVTMLERIVTDKPWYKVQTADKTQGWLSSEVVTASGNVQQLPEATPLVEQPTAEQPTTVPVPDENVTPTPLPSTEPVVDITVPTPTPTVTTLPVTSPEPTAPKPTAKPTETKPTATAKPTPTPKPTAKPLPVGSKRWVWPTRGRLSSGYGYRWLSRRRTFHNGIDLANKKWTNIYAARGGTVVQAGWCSGYGYCVKMNHGDGMVTEYGHMASRPIVRAGQFVQAGKLIGYMGATYDRSGGGYATGIHLHFTVKINGRAVNPMRYLP